MNKNLSLSKLLNHSSNPDIGERILKRTKEIKVDKQKLSDVAEEYGKKYKNEILEGTRKRQLLLSEGSKRGLSEEESIKEYGKFIPSVYTPIMNFLYFMILEGGDENRQTTIQRDKINEALMKHGQYSYDNENEKDLSNDEIMDILKESCDDNMINTAEETKTNGFRTEINNKFSQEEREDLKFKDPEDMETFLFGNLTLEQFNTLKKLKSLTYSDNVDEATLAFSKGKELAKKYGVDWDKIPSYYKKSK